MELTANTAQTVTVGNHVLFTDVAIPGNCSMIHRPGSGVVTLRGITNQARARYKITFIGNLAAPVGTTDFTPLELAIAINGEGVEATNATYTPIIVGRFQNVSTSTFIDVPKGCNYQLSIKNVGVDALSIANSNLLVERVA